MDSQYEFFTRQFLFQLPFLLASLVGIVVSIVFWGRSRGAAALTLFASLALGLTGLFVPTLQTYLAFARLNRGWPETTYGFWSGAVSIMSSSVRALAFIGLSIAVFLGRRRA